MTKISTLTSVFALALAVSPVMANAKQAGFTTTHGVIYSVNHKGPATAPGAQDPASKIYKFDDGVSEDAIAFGNGVSNVKAIWFDQFKTVKGGEAISSVQIAFGTPANSTPAKQLNGKAIIVGIWSDPNNDGDPTDAVLIGSVKGKISSANTDTLVTYTFATPVFVGPKGTSFFVGDVTPAFSKSELFFQGIDETTPQGHSWVAAQANGGKLNVKRIGKNDTVGTIDSFGLPGNWLIRATGVPSTGN
jgi:hypothetical protein